ncbi:hypothetical protein TIFTF001_001238 [Ficus carica]|uniref:3-beta hydroxysteroid dehydrogenase/isomerase domain-containing protein n=1 Tax=Ficus carica TaxID=3494 RepID=A0AA87ZEV7_FICCA|nr:hypothetical protein TIFTF001_001238 [Ficus carica]
MELKKGFSFSKQTYWKKVLSKDRLQLFKANLLEEGSFDSAVDGCEGVFHTASPVYSHANDPEAELLEPALKGTLNVLKSCAKSPSVRLVVLTSSAAAVLINGKPLTPDVVGVFRLWLFVPRVVVVGGRTFPNYSFGWVNVIEMSQMRIFEHMRSLRLEEDIFWCADDRPFMPTYQVSKEKAKSLGVEYTPLEEPVCTAVGFGKFVASYMLKKKAVVV